MKPGSRFAVLLAMLSLACACATPQQAREKGALTTYASSKTSRSVSDCIASAWEDNGHVSQVSVRPREHGYSVQLAQEGNVQLLVDVTDAVSGSVTETYKGHVVGAGKLLALVQTCQ
jgi:hypothetical protein